MEPPSIPLQPMPTMVAVGQAPSPDGQMHVLLRLSTPLGTSTFFLDSEVAATVGAKMAEFAKGAASNLILPGPIPNGQSFGPKP